MNKFITLLFVLSLIIASGCRYSAKSEHSNSGVLSSDTGKAKISFREYEHEFGKVAEGEKISYVFTFENKGTSDLVITSATTTCGCTVPKYDTKPIQPGGNGNLEVVFDTSGRSGMQTKTVTVKSNASVPEVLIKITAEVVTEK